MRSSLWAFLGAVALAAGGCSLALFDEPIDEDAGTDGTAEGDVPIDGDVSPDVEADGDLDGETEVGPDCGNGTLDDGEECDDGNGMNGDGCNDDCRYTCHGDTECREDPDDPCTNNFCESVATGRMCNWTANDGVSCDDFDSCTETDVCNAEGVCVGSDNICGCPSGMSDECAAFEDGNLCNGTLVCNMETRFCEVDPTTIVTCPEDQPCRTYACVPETGECPGTTRAPGSPCDDGVFCNGAETCDDTAACVSAGSPCPGSCRTCNETTDACDVTIGCWIDGACVEQGTPRPGFPCQHCNDAVSRTAWSNRPASSVCDDGDECTDGDRCDAAGVCVPGTRVCGCPGGTTAECVPFEDGDRCNGTLRCNAARMCEVDPATIVACPADEPCKTYACVPSTGACPATNRPAGTSCDDRTWCNGADTCNGLGTCAHAGDPCPQSCRTCNETTDACDVVAGSCWIDDVCYGNGQVRSGYPCQFCDPTASWWSWSNRPTGASCDDGSYCNGADTCGAAGLCTHAGDPCPEWCRTCNETADRCDVSGGCFIDATCYTGGAYRPGSLCQYCDAAAAPTAWTSRPNGSACDDGVWCNGSDACAAGTCVSSGARCTESCRTCNESTDACDVVSGCWIDGACWAAGAGNPTDLCQFCDPAASRTSWWPRPAGASCDDGLWCNGTATCVGGVCASAGSPCTASCVTCNESFDRCDVASNRCWIGGNCHLDATINASNTCQWCRSAVSQTSWSPRPDFTPCSLVTAPLDLSYDICSAGTCVSPGACGTAACNAPGPNFPLADTNVRFCYNDTALLSPCPGTPDTAACATTNFCGQDAQYGWDVTHVSTARFTRTLPTSAHPIVTDNVTGLVWQGCPAGQTGTVAACTGVLEHYDWFAARSYCESLYWGGFTDWSLPNQYELVSIVDFFQSGCPRINTIAFPGSECSYVYWASDTQADYSSGAWGVAFGTGAVLSSMKTSIDLVRCVRHGTGTVDGRFVRTVPVADEPIVADNATDLVWQGCPAGLRGSACTTGSPAASGWRAALAYCQALSWGGRNDWYLPNVDELASLLDHRRVSPMINVTAFPGTPAYYFWSSTSNAAPADTAWNVGFDLGGLFSYNKASYTLYYRCVRPGP
jgi:hypothetical protein